MTLRKRRQFKYEIDSVEMQEHSRTGRHRTWVSSNGGEKYVMNMDSNHIKNAVAKINRGELDNRKEFLPIFKNELIYRELYNTESDNLKTTNKHGRRSVRTDGL